MPSLKPPEIIPSGLLCKHCGKPIRRATREECEETGIDYDDGAEWKHEHKIGWNFWMCEDRGKNWIFNVAEPEDSATIAP